MRGWSWTHERVIGATVATLCLLIGAINPVFFSVGNLFDLLRSATVLTLFALGALVVIASGGIDVSFTAVAVCALYGTVRLLNGWGVGSLAAAYALAALIGLALGAVNGLLVARFALPTLIATLGTQGVFRGGLLFFVGSTLTRELPAGMEAFGRARLVEVQTASGALTGLPLAVLLPLGAALLVALLLRHSVAGRTVYALGGAPEAARRAGINVGRTQLTIYAAVGALAGVAGLTYGALNRQANPFDLVGSELDVIAAVVLGGAQISGGSGTVRGTLLGVALIVIINNSLILVGVPSVWQRVAIGALIIIGTVVAATNRNGAARLTAGLVTEERR